VLTYREWIRDRQPSPWTLCGRVYVPSRSDAASAGLGAKGRRMAYRVFLPAARWVIRLEGEGTDGARARIDGEALTRGAGSEFRWRATTAGWQLLEISADQPVTLQHLRFATEKEGVS